MDALGRGHFWIYFSVRVARHVLVGHPLSRAWGNVRAGCCGCGCQLGTLSAFVDWVRWGQRYKRNSARRVNCTDVLHRVQTQAPIKQRSLAGLGSRPHRKNHGHSPNLPVVAPVEPCVFPADGIGNLGTAYQLVRAEGSTAAGRGLDCCGLRCNATRKLSRYFRAYPPP
jgi:hypothetical protein